MDDLDLIKDMLPFLIPLIIIELGLMVIALVDLVKRPQVKGGNKFPWILLVVFISLFGPIIYLLFGRKDEAAGSDKM